MQTEPRKTRSKIGHFSPQIITAYNNGSTLRQIAAFFGCSAGTVRNLLHSHGISLRPQGRRKREEAPQQETIQ